jgi:hypothetical protein
MAPRRRAADLLRVRTGAPVWGLGSLVDGRGDLGTPDASRANVGDPPANRGRVTPARWPF